MPINNQVITDLVSASELFYSSLRKDWYVSNQTMPKVARACLEGRRNIKFVGFPRQWIPIFEWYGLKWSESIEPEEYIPFFSDFKEETIIQVVNEASKEKSLRALVESATIYDSVLSDFLYILDHTAGRYSRAMQNEISEIQTGEPRSKKRPLMLNGWQAYGRPSVRLLETEVMKVVPKKDLALVLPCSLRRPYWKSSTHKRIYRQIEELGFCLPDFHRIVITSLGVLPEEVWEMPQVLSYDSGVPDIYRILRLTRSYFKKAKYQNVMDCLQFEPFSDVLRIVHNEGLIKELHKVKIPGSKPFYIRA